MKIEKLSENKIKCTLNRDDLDSRDIMLTEFAYGSEKARAFFRDLMIQAEEEVGFEAEDIPLMIEAVPVSQDCIVLFVTKVSDPEELDTRFSRFTQGKEEDSEEYDEEEFDEDSAEGLYHAVKDAVKSAMEGISQVAQEAAGDTFIPLNESIEKVEKDGTKRVEAEEKPKVHTAIYTFSQLDDVCMVASYLQGEYHGDNTLYKDMVGGEYTLILSSGGEKPENFTKVLNRISEYGVRKRCTYATQAYYEEHDLCVIRSNALQTLAGL